jgi:hypothetical protein
MLSPADHLGADELEDPGGMTWREVKDFLDHMRETCIKDRQELKLEVRRLRAENERLAALIDGSTDG